LPWLLHPPQAASTDVITRAPRGVPPSTLASSATPVRIASPTTISAGLSAGGSVVNSAAKPKSALIACAISAFRDEPSPECPLTTQLRQCPLFCCAARPPEPILRPAILGLAASAHSRLRQILLQKPLSSRTPRERAPVCPSFLRISPSLPTRPATHRPALDRPAARRPRAQARTNRSRRRNGHKPRFRAAFGVTCRLRILKPRPAVAFRG